MTRRAARAVHRSARRHRASDLLIACTLLAGTSAACRRDSAPDSDLPLREPLLVEAAVPAGLDFAHWNGRTGRFFYAEVIGAGVALLDHDADGDLDLFVRQGHLLDPTATVDAALDTPPAGPLGASLYANRGVHEGLPRFLDVTAASGIVETGYGMGIATGDVDNDGHLDILTTRLDGATLWHNRGNGTFADETATRGIAVDGWATSATLFDADRDGWLDLYVARYVSWTPALDRPCYDQSSRPDYCGPQTYRPLPDLYFHNRGDGTFEDATARSGIGAVASAGLGVAAADLDGDGWQDLYVANDAMPNFFWRNRGDGRFEEIAVERGCAVDLSGAAEAGMGIWIADLEQDGDEDVFVTNLDGETNTLYVNAGDGWFEDRTIPAGLAAPSLPFTGFGTALLDLGNDGLPDLMVANGAIRQLPARLAAGDPFPLGQRNHWYRALDAAGRFALVEGNDATALSGFDVSRGLAVGDVDGDGAQDVVIANNNGPLRLLLDRGARGRHWLGLRLLSHGRDALGAQVRVHTGSGRVHHARAHADGSYLSASDPRVWVGLGEDVSPIAEVRVRWPTGEIERFVGLAVDQVATLARGSGTVVESSLDSGAPAAEPPVAPTPGKVAITAPATLAPGDVAHEQAIEAPGGALEAFAMPSLAGLEPVVGEALTAAASSARANGSPASAWGELGRTLHGYGFPATAVVAYRNAERLDPAAGRWPYLRGLAALAAGDLDEAGPAFARANTAVPAAPWPRLRLAVVRQQQGRLDGLEALLAPVIADTTVERPLRALAAAQIAEVARLRDDAPAAIAAYRQALALAPDATALHAPLARLLARQGDEPGAREHRRLAGRAAIGVIDPEENATEELDRSGAGHARRGQDALLGDDPARALGELEEAHRLLPADATVAVNLGVARLRLGRTRTAEEAFRAALARAPGHPVASYNLGVLAAASGRDREAIARYETALAADPELTDARFNLANARWRLGETTAAIEAWRAVLAADPARRPARLALTRGLAASGRHAEALAVAEAGLRREADSPPLRDAVARLLATRGDAGDGERAVTLAEANLKAERTLEHVETVAMAYAAAGRFLDAARWQQAAIVTAERAGEHALRDELTRRLADYLAGQPARSPWRESEVLPTRATIGRDSG